MSTPTDSKPEIISIQHQWKVYDWVNGGWSKESESDTVYTWTKNHSLACRKARINAPVRIQTRFKVVYDRAKDISHLGLELMPRKVREKNWLSQQVEDSWGELCKLVEENIKREREVSG